jgi:nitrous oxide reductase
MAEKKTRKNLSRREFLKDAAVLGGAVVSGGILAGGAPPAPAAAQTPTALQKAIGYVSYGCVSFQLKGARLAPCKLHPFRWFQLI